MTFNNRTLRRASTYIAVLGVLDSVYLLIAKVLNSRAMCIEGLGDCWSVNNSAYSEIAGVPIALLGAGTYLAILALLWLENRNQFWKSNSVLFIFGITLFGVLYSAYLTFIEVAVLRAICPFCVVSAIAMLILFAITLARLVQGQAESNP